MCKEYPERMQWWANLEINAASTAKGAGRRFRDDREDYATILRLTRDQGVLLFDLDDDLPCDMAGCGI